MPNIKKYWAYCRILAKGCSPISMCRQVLKVTISFIYKHIIIGIPMPNIAKYWDSIEN